MKGMGTTQDWLKRISYCLAAGFILLRGLPNVNGQVLPSRMDDVKFTLDVPSMNPPVKVTRILLDGKLVSPDKSVAVDGAWMGKIVVEIQNISAKDIVYGELILTFPETGSGTQGNPVLSSLSSLGREPNTAFRLKDGATRPMSRWMLRRPEIHIPAGETMRFEFGPEDTQANAYRLAGQVHLVRVTPRTFYFSDGSKWQGGTFLNPVPAPTLWEEASPEPFFQKAASSVRDYDERLCRGTRS